MKTILLVLSFLMVLLINSTAQITVKSNITEKPVITTKSYDSLKPLTNQVNPIDFKQYIGLKLFFLPESKKYLNKFTKVDSCWVAITSLYCKKRLEIKDPNDLPFEESREYLGGILRGGMYTKKDIEKNKMLLSDYNKAKDDYESKMKKISTNVYQPYFLKNCYDINARKNGLFATIRDKVENKYFTIINIKCYNNEKEKYENLENIDRVADANDETAIILNFILINDEVNDTLYWVTDSRKIEDYPFLLVPYFTKQKKKYEGVKLIAKSDMSNLVDINTGKIIHVSFGDNWKCTEVSLLELETFRNFEPCYILKNENNEEIKIRFQDLSDETFELVKQFNQTSDNNTKNSNSCELKDKLLKINDLIDQYIKNEMTNIENIKKAKETADKYYLEIKNSFDATKSQKIQDILNGYNIAIDNITPVMSQEQVLRMTAWNGAMKEQLRRNLCDN